jgi:hypothetical protein
MTLPPPTAGLAEAAGCGVGSRVGSGADERFDSHSPTPASAATTGTATHHGRERDGLTAGLTTVRACFTVGARRASVGAGC